MDQKLTKRVGHNISQLRAKAGLTLKELAKKSKLSIPFLSRLENGKISPSLTSLDSIARALNVDVGYFLQYESNKIDLYQMLVQRLNLRREELGLTVRQLAEEAGLAEAYVDHIGENKAIPSLSDLSRLARALKTSAGYFFQSEEEKDYFIYRKGHSKIRYFLSGPKNKPAYEIEMLAEGFENRFMEPSLTTLTGRDEDISTNSHAGQDFIYVLQGQVEISLGQNKFILNEGDAIYFNSRLPHKGISLSDVPAKTLQVHLMPLSAVSVLSPTTTE